MTEGGSPWDDPAVDVGFRAAYEPYVPRQTRALLVEDPPAPPLAQDAPLPREEQAHRLSPSRALAGAAVSVAGVALGITTLLWVTGGPSVDAGSSVRAPVGEEAPSGAAPQESAPVDPPAAVPPPAAPAPVAPPVAAPAPVVPPVVVPVTVLNNSRLAGLADRGAAQFAAAGWPVAGTGNYRGRIRSTTVYYPAGLEPAAREFAGRFAGVQRVLPRPANLPGSGLTVVLTRDFSS